MRRVLLSSVWTGFWKPHKASTSCNSMVMIKSCPCLLTRKQRVKIKQSHFIGWQSDTAQSSKDYLEGKIYFHGEPSKNFTLPVKFNKVQCQTGCKALGTLSNLHRFRLTSRNCNMSKTVSYTKLRHIPHPCHQALWWSTQQMSQLSNKLTG